MEDADLVNAVQDLQKSVAALEQRNRDLVLKAQIFSMRAARTWGWDKFLSEPEFWENIYDSGLADCQGRCISNLQEEYKACDTAHEKYSTEWENCRAEALGRAVLCQERCADANPVVP
jgi:hypothetical protein